MTTDVILDMAGDRTLADLRQALRPDGTLVPVVTATCPLSEAAAIERLV